jgi:hypothetical protein
MFLPGGPQTIQSPAGRWLRLSDPTLSLFIASAAAVDGVIEINQAKALAGGVTPGDTAGFPVALSAPGSYRERPQFQSSLGRRKPKESQDGCIPY